MKILKLAFCWNNVKLSNKEQNVNFALIVFNKMDKIHFARAHKGGQPRYSYTWSLQEMDLELSTITVKIN